MASRFASTVARIGRLLLDFSFPPQCALCKGELDTCFSPVCEKCYDSLVLLPHQRLFDPVYEGAFSAAYAVWTFSDPFQELVHLLKYGNRPVVGTALAKRMAAMLIKDAWANIDGLVPVPLHSTRKRERGYNQSEVIGKELSRRLGIPLETGLLKWIRQTATQTKLNRAARAKNLLGAFQVCRCVAGRRLLLLDDVFTTGSTVDKCANMLMEAGAGEVRVLTAARVV